MAQSTAPAYVPGVCNINTAETDRRRRIGYIGTVIYIVILIALLALPVSRWLRPVLILPAILAASGFLQARNHFCVGYAAAGLQNAADGSDKAMNVSEQAALAKDKQRARELNRQSIIIGVVAGLVPLLIPIFRH